MSNCGRATVSSQAECHVLPQRVRCDQLSAMLMQRSRVPEQARGNTPPKLKIHVTSKSPVGDISVVTLIRTILHLIIAKRPRRYVQAPAKLRGAPASLMSCVCGDGTAVRPVALARLEVLRAFHSANSVVLLDSLGATWDRHACG